MTKRELKLLRSLLRSKGAYIKFMLNAKRAGISLHALSICPLAHSIACAFIWADTPEGRDYWSKLNDELMDLRWKQELLNKHR